jgi:hypothetical protein
MRGRILTNIFEMKWYNFWDALTRKRNDGTLVRLITPVGPDEKTADAEKRLTEMAQQIIVILDRYLPGLDQSSSLKAGSETNI